MWSAGFKVEALVLLITCSLVLLLALRKCFAKDKGSFPPGPFAWPIIGHLHLFSHLPHQALRNLSAQYGPILGLRLGHHRGVVVSTPAFAQQILVTHDKILANRPPYDFSPTLMYGRQGILMNNYGPQWRKLRKLCALELFSPKRLQELEYVRKEEICTLVQRIHDESSGGMRVVDITKCIVQMTTNIMMRLVCSDACGPSKEGENFPMLVREMEEEAAPTVGDFIPWLKWVDFVRKRRMRHLHARFDKFLTTILAGRQSAMHTLSASAPHDDLLHALLSKVHVNDDNSERVTMQEIKVVMLDMLAGGLHTTALTLEWAMAELLKNPHCLDRLQKEIYSVLMLNGKSKKYVTNFDITKLSYLKCVVKEVLRLHPSLPLLMSHIGNEECKVHNYILPAQTQVFVNVWAIGRDEQVWPMANQFRPERFEDKDIDAKGQYFELLPFGSGRRICPGLPLALLVVEATLANLVCNFNWELPPGETCASMDMNEKRGISLSKATPVIALPKLHI